MTFKASDFQGFVAKDSEVQARLFTQYLGYRDDFDIIIIGSGMGGGILADDLADRVGNSQRILVLEAGSYLFPTHVYNISRFDNGGVARSFACQSFYQDGGFTAERYIHEQPQLNLGGRSIFWSGLIPTIQPWELQFFPASVRAALMPSVLENAGKKMNESKSLGEFSQQIVDHLSNTSLGDDFEIQQTPRALHQPYLTQTGQAKGQYFSEPTGVFNTSELLINQLGRDRNHDGNGLHLQIHQYVEDIVRLSSGWFRVLGRTTTTGEPRYYYAPQVVLAGGAIESPKLLNRSTVAQTIDPGIRSLIGKGLTDHPTTDSRTAAVSHCGTLSIPKNEHAKIILYSKGYRDSGGIRFPFNVEININHEYWHKRDIDPDSGMRIPTGASVLDFKYSFANCIDQDNAIYPTPPFQYVPKIDFRNLNWTTHTAYRLAVLAGWNKTPSEIFSVLNGVGQRLLNEFSFNGSPVNPSAELGQQGTGFGRGTVHHAAGSLHMPHVPALDQQESQGSVVDEDLAVRDVPGMYVCDMSVMPISSAANPVRTLAALALRLSERLY
ncbi:MAG: GMC oxidoreductase [Pseudomonadales bacterium]|nr:GMC oxidoreductase [Pseudomonadales bacterium]